MRRKVDRNALENGFTCSGLVYFSLCSVFSLRRVCLLKFAVVEVLGGHKLCCSYSLTNETKDQVRTDHGSARWRMEMLNVQTRKNWD